MAGRIALVIVTLAVLSTGSCSRDAPTAAAPTSTMPPRTPPSPPPNNIESFVADRTTVRKGDTVTFSWAVSGTVSYCKIWTGIEPEPRVLVADGLPPIGSLRVVPTGTAWYGLVTYLADGRAILESDIRVVVE